MSDQRKYEFENELEEESEVAEPSRYKVLLLNDNYTTMEFVIEILMTIFKKSQNESMNIMLNVHKTGKGLCGIYTYEIAETKVEQVKIAARDNDFPLRVIMEEE